MKKKYYKQACIKLFHNIKFVTKGLHKKVLLSKSMISVLKLGQVF